MTNFNIESQSYYCFSHTYAYVYVFLRLRQRMPKNIEVTNNFAKTKVQISVSNTNKYYTRSPKKSKSSM